MELIDNEEDKEFLRLQRTEERVGCMIGLDKVRAKQADRKRQRETPAGERKKKT